MRRLQPRTGLTVLISVLAAAIYSTVTLVRFSTFVPVSFDNAIFEQAIKSYARPGAPIVDVKGPGFNILGDHFSPIYTVIAPVYRLFPSAQTVLLAQVLLIAISVAVIAHLAMRVLGTRVGVVVAVLYALSFGLQSAVAADFHEVAFAAPLLALAGAAYVDRRWRAVVAWSVPLVLVKEDLGLTVAVVGVVLYLSGQKRLGQWVAIGGLVATAVTVLVIIPAFATDGYAYASSLGGERGLVATLTDEPARKIATAAVTVAVTGFAALFSPWALLALPTFAWRFAGDNSSYWGLDFHYSLVLMPIVFVAAIDAMQRHDNLRKLVPVGVVATAISLIGSPVAMLFDPDFYRAPDRADTAQAIVEEIPAGASVETDIGLMTHLVTDHTVYWVGSIDAQVAPDYIAFDLAGGFGSPSNPEAYAFDTYGEIYEVVIDRDGYVLLEGPPAAP
ncbi:DUF2079 domain-containing protein [Aeromicrobium sp. CF3.5]|uniref:DUF2079 domain-containing protein n=1 Tax=Aeromicrobium sp. CF3.5 TaxID=3373078 RepID=UPI003EE74BBA